MFLFLFIVKFHSSSPVVESVNGLINIKGRMKVFNYCRFAKRDGFGKFLQDMKKRKMSKSDWFQIDNLRLVRVFLDRFFSNRKLVIVVLVLLVILIYFGPSWFSQRRDHDDEHFACFKEHLENFYAKDEAQFDTFVHRVSHGGERKFYVPYVGNGYFGLSLSETYNPQLRIRHDKRTKLFTGFEPLVKIQPKFPYSFKSEAYILELRKGSATKMTAFNLGGECIFLSSMVYAHRSRPSLFVHEITVQNPTMSSLTFSLDRSTPDAGRFRILKSDQKLTSKVARINVPDGQNKFYVLGLVQREISKELIVKPRSTETIRIFTVISVSESVDSAGADAIEKQLDQQLPKLYDEASKDETRLFSEHVASWNKLWSHGFSISFSKAPDVINGGLINATIYYLLSNTPSPLQERGVNASVLASATKLLYTSDGCYNKHNTLMYPSKLWSHLSTIENVLEAVNWWKLTLNKGGCSSLVNAGAEGLLQAIILSLGGLQFTNHHLEFGIDPKDLHRHYFFRGIFYGDSALVNIWVEVGVDNKPVLYVSVNSSKPKEKRYFACDAGCLDPPAELSNDKTIFPVKLTNPVTAILYITDDQQHIADLKHTIHVKEVVEAPAHEHHVIAMHKHGHRLGGLPTLFWVALIFLLITFHLFLFKLIYNELCRDEKPSYPPPVNRMRYAV